MARTNLTTGTSVANAVTYTTAIVSPGANRLVLAFVLSAEVAFQTATVPSLTGAGLTWVLVETIAAAGIGDHRLTCFRAMGAAPTPGALTISFGAALQDLCAWSVFEYDGVDTSGANGAGAIVQSKAQTGSGTALTVGLNPFADPVNNLAVGGIILDLFVDPVRPINPGAGLTEIHEQSPNQPAGKSGTLQTQDRTGAATSVSWTWNGTENAAAIALELKAAAVPTPGASAVEQLVRRFEPVLFFHQAESFFPSDAKRYIEHAALWKADAPFDAKSSWGGTATPFPKAPIIPAGSIAARADEPGTYLGDPPNLVAAEAEERFLQLGGWKDKAGTAQPAVTTTSVNVYADRGSIFNRYQSEPALAGSRFWYHAEVFDAGRLKQLAATVPAPDLSKVYDSLKNPTLVCYYLFFPAHEQTVNSGCTNVEAREIGAFAGEWGCVAVLLEDTPAGPQQPAYIGLSGSQTPFFQDSSGKLIQRPQAFDDERRIVLKVERWRPGTGPGATLPELIDDHPRLFVARGTHSLYMQSGPQPVVPFPIDVFPRKCGRFDTAALTPKDPQPYDEPEDVGVLLAKLLGPGLLGLGPLGLLGGVVSAMIEGLLPYPGQGLSLVGDVDAAPDDDVPAAGTGTTVAPVGLTVPDAGATVEPWRSAQGVTLNGRRYDFLVDRQAQVWWPADDGDGGYQGRWGQRVEADPLPRRSGMRFPAFWKMFLLAIADGKATGLLA